MVSGPTEASRLRYCSAATLIGKAPLTADPRSKVVSVRSRMHRRESSSASSGTGTIEHTRGSPPFAMIAHAILAILLASAMTPILVGRRCLATSPIQAEKSCPHRKIFGISDTGNQSSRQ